MRSLRFIAALVSAFVVLAPAAANADSLSNQPVLRAVVIAPSTASADGQWWLSGGETTIAYDFTQHNVASDHTTVQVGTDGKYLYLHFQADQHEAITANNRTNGVGGSDDMVGVVLWPDGANGIQYFFTSTPIGTRTQTSSENQDYAPTWDATAMRTASGYVVQMKIPLSAIHSTGSSQWRVQFVRFIAGTNQFLEWSHATGQSSPFQVQYAGLLTGLIGSRTVQAPRIQPYGLFGNRRNAGAHFGLDFSVPFLGTSAVYGTVHPDYSDIERDQASIAPSEYARKFQEVRPFFTQAAGYYNPSGNTDLYTPIIPTPEEGLAVEGSRSLYQYAAFVTQGAGDRRDDAWVASYHEPSARFTFSTQHVGVDLPGFVDNVQSTTAAYDNLKNFSAYATYALDRGTNVTNNALGNEEQTGVRLYSPTAYAAVNLLSQGALYAPADGYVGATDIAGYNAVASKQWNYAPASVVTKASIYAYLDRYHGKYAGGLDQVDQSLSASLTIRNRYTAGISSGSSYGFFGQLMPFNQNSFWIQYYDTQKGNGVFASASEGAWLNGYLRSDSISVSRYFSKRLFVSAEDDLTRFAGTTDADGNLLRLSGNYAITPDSSLSISWRRIGGISPPPQYPEPTGTNFSFAFSARSRWSHYYFVYGDPSAPTTTGSFAFKIVRFIGSEEGT